MLQEQIKKLEGASSDEKTQKHLEKVKEVLEGGGKSEDKKADGYGF